MFRSISRVFAPVVRAGRFKHSFAINVVLALFTLPVATALAYFGATGTGTISNVAAGTSSSTVSIAFSGSSFTYAGPSTTALVPGGTVSFPVQITCTAGAPCTVPSVSLLSWTSSKTGCDSTTMPNSFTIQSQTASFPITIATVGAAGADSLTILWNNLATSQTACAGGTFAFVLNVP